MKRNKPKVLKSSLREKKRYLAIKIEFGEISLEEFEKSLKKEILDLFGEVGYAKINFEIIKNLWNEKEKVAVIKCNYKEIEKLRFALCLLNEIEGKKVVVSCLGVSGTLKALKRKFIPPQLF